MSRASDAEADVDPNVESARHPRLVAEKPPLMDALTFQTCTAVLRVDEELRDLNARMDRLG